MRACWWVYPGWMLAAVLAPEHALPPLPPIRGREGEISPPTEVAGYITIAWSQLHWGFLNDPAYIRQNTVRGARAASVCVRWPLSDAAATLLSCAQAQVLRQHIHTRVAGFIEHVSA